MFFIRNDGKRYVSYGYVSFGYVWYIPQNVCVTILVGNMSTLSSVTKRYKVFSRVLLLYLYMTCLGGVKKAYEILNLRALKFSPVNEMHIF